jgi:hypothetical protein
VEQVRFTPLTPARLADALSDWVLDRARQLGPPAGAVIGFDGPAEIGTTALADAVAGTLRGSGRQIIRASTSWWWRPSALRLEFGRQDLDMLLIGWVDSDAIRRELVQPVRVGGSTYITRLRDPDTDRSVRQRADPVSPGAVLLLDGPFLLAADLPLDAMVGFSVSRGFLDRALPDDRRWWVGAFSKYQDDYAPASRSDVLLSYDHATAPAASGLKVSRLR